MSPRFRGDPENAIQARVVKLFRQAGCKVYPTSSYRVSRIAVGMADLYVVPPFGPAFWFECKSPNGRLTAEQKNFRSVVQSAGVGYVSGGYDEAVDSLVRLAVLVPQTRSA